MARARLGSPMLDSVELVATLDRRNLGKLAMLEKASKLEAAKALTFTAEKAKPAWQAGQSRVFHERNSWVKGGVRIRAATPGSMAAKVGSIDSFLQRHVIGLGEEKRSSGGRLFIPTYDAISHVGTHRQTRRKLAGYERTKRKPFLIQAKSGHTMLVRRKGKARTPLVVLASLEQSAMIEPTLDALTIVANTANREFGPIYERLLLAWAARQ